MRSSFSNIKRRSSTELPTIFLPGWGFDGRISRLLQPAPGWIYPESLLDPATMEEDLLLFIQAEKISRVRIIGWSMGAMLALEFGARHRDLLESLVLVALRPGWPQHEIREIRSRFSRSPEDFLRDFYRKCFLGNREAYRKFRATLEPLYLAGAQANRDRLLHGLDFLASFRMPAPPLPVPTRLVHGRQDIIAPVRELADLPGAAVEIIDNAGHAVLLHPDTTLQQEVKKQIIRLKFSRAAESYDTYAKIQAEVAGRLAAKLPPASAEAPINRILEIGCGTGNFTALLAAKYPAAKLVALDFSPEMLARARSKLPNSTIEFLCADGEKFLQDGAAESFDLVASNGALQWFPDIDRALKNIARILPRHGFMACSLFGPESLKELGEGLQAIRPLDEGLTARRFLPLPLVRQALHQHFPAGKIEEEYFAREYSSARELLLHLKKTGTSGWRQNGQQFLTAASIRQLDEWFAKTRGACRVTYQVLFLQGHR